MKNLLTEFIENSTKKRLIRKNDSIIIACSGGIDSVVLFHLFYSIKDKYNLDIKVAHFNHSLRGEDSDEDEVFVKKLAAEFSLDFYSDKKDVKSYAADKKMSIQEAARYLRYEFLCNLSDGFPNSKVATGHNRDDKIETIFYNFIKGYGVFSLTGIPLSRDNIIRPLLFATREKILDFSEKNKISFRLDKSNLKSEYIRNKIRLNLFPEIDKNYVKNFQNNIDTLDTEMSEIIEFIESEVRKVYQESIIKRKNRVRLLNISKYENYFSVVRKRLIYYILVYDFSIEKRIGNRFLEEIDNLILNGKTGRLKEIDTQLKLFKDREFAVFGSLTGKKYCIKFKPETYIKSDNFFINSKILDKKFLKESKGGNNIYNEIIDFNLLPSDTVIRNWQPGDFIVPFSKNKPKKIKKIFVENKLFEIDKKRYPLLASGKEIYWVPGLKLSEKLRITEKTTVKLGLNYKINRIIV